MNIVRVCAYSVEPERTARTLAVPFGGSITVTAQIRTALEDAASQSTSQRPIAVDLQVDVTTRTSDIRDMIMDFAFGNKPKAEKAGSALAAKLSHAMDLRSSPCLYVLAASKDDRSRALTMWTFPREEAFQFRGTAGHPSIQLLTDIFSRTSRLRKAALFEGRNLRTDFIAGKVFDFQASSAAREVADFWIVRFLGAVLSIHGPTGTKHLARCLRSAYEEATTPTEQEQIYSAVVAVRISRRPRWSLREFADQFLTGHAWEAFVAAAPNQETLDSSFDFDRNTFDDALNFRIFGLNTGVFVSSPLGEVGRSVVLSGTTEKTLRCEGRVVEEHLRKRHG
jgi:hypothetical protein